MQYADLPDILVLSMDTMRRDNMAPYGNDLMPAATNLLENGVAFDKCFVTAPWTGGSFGSMFTGLWPRQHGCVGTFKPGSPSQTWPLKSDVRLLPEILRDAGYHTIACQANQGILGPGGGFARGYDDYCVWEGYTYLKKRLGLLGAEKEALSYAGMNRYLRYCAQRVKYLLTKRGSEFSLMRCAEAIVDKTCRMLHRSPDDKPLFCWINFMDMHTPYVVPDRWIGPIEPPGGVVKPVYLYPARYSNVELSDAEKQYIRQSYDSGARYINSCMSDLLAQWRTLRPRRSRMTVFHSDHGEEFWDHHQDFGDPYHGLRGAGHCHSLYNELLLVPFIIHWPEIATGGTRVNDVVSMIDFTPTIVELLGLKEDTSHMQGRSLSDYVISGSSSDNNDRIVFADSVVSSFERQAAISGTHKLIRFVESGETSLFAWGMDDPGEKLDLTESPQHADVRNRMTTALDEWNASMTGIEQTHSYSPEEQEAVEARLRDLGYI